MIRLIFWVLLILLLGAAAAWVAGHPGALTLQWEGRNIEMPVGYAAGLLVLLLLALQLLYRFWHWLRRGPGAWGSARAARRRRLGYRALTHGMVAVAAGDAVEAKRLAVKAEQLLDEPPLTLLLAAQAAQLGGDEAAAERYFSAMLERPETEFLGLRGLLAQAVRKQDRLTALRLATRARELRPNTPWVLRELFALQSAEGLWPDAETTLAQAIKHKALPAAEGRRAQAIVAFEQAQGAEQAGQPDRARKLALQAVSLSPDLVPAIVLAASLLAAAGKRRRAVNLLTESWIQVPHPDLAQAYAGLFPDEDAAERLRRAQELAAHRPDHVESRLVLAEAALAAGDLATARKQLEPLVKERLTPRTAGMMAELEEKQYGDAASAREWLIRAAHAAPDPAWICRTCGAQGQAWAARCGACGGFDTLHWQQPVGMAPMAVPALAAAGAPATAPAAPALPGS